MINILRIWEPKIPHTSRFQKTQKHIVPQTKFHLPLSYNPLNSAPRMNHSFPIPQELTEHLANFDTGQPIVNITSRVTYCGTNQACQCSLSGSTVQTSHFIGIATFGSLNRYTPLSSLQGVALNRLKGSNVCTQKLNPITSYTHHNNL